MHYTVTGHKGLKNGEPDMDREENIKSLAMAKSIAHEFYNTGRYQWVVVFEWDENEAGHIVYGIPGME